MTILSQISGPDDLKGRSFVDLTQLAAEIRSELINTVTRTGGHLGSHFTLSRTSRRSI